MHKGFGSKQQTKDQYIKRFFKSSKVISSGFATPEEARESQSLQWLEECKCNYEQFSIKELLEPQFSPLIISYNRKVTGDSNNTVAIAGFRGIWQILVQEREDKSLDFSISALVGPRYRFHPTVIKQVIRDDHGIDAYNKWRAMVNKDIESLVELARRIASEIDTVAWSYTCTDCSDRLCRRAGISTHRGIGFLFPDSYKN